MTYLPSYVVSYLSGDWIGWKQTHGEILKRRESGSGEGGGKSLQCNLCGLYLFRKLSV
jgi:hypothetical protein